MTRATLNDKLAEYFKARPGVWLDGMQLSKVAGQYSWRTRCSNLRKRGMVIQNRQRKQTDRYGRVWTTSEYIYLPPAEPQQMPLEARA